MISPCGGRRATRGNGRRGPRRGSGRPLVRHTPTSSFNASPLLSRSETYFTDNPYSSKHELFSLAPLTAAALQTTRRKRNYANRRKLHAARTEFEDKDLIGWLPFAAYEPRTIKNYSRIGDDFVAFCDARGISSVPAGYYNLTSFLWDYMERGNTARNFNPICSSLKWYFIHILHENWIDVTCPAGYHAFLRARRAMKKFDTTMVKKAKPLYLVILKLLHKRILAHHTRRFEVLAMWTLANAAMQRIGELANGTARVKHLKYYNSPLLGEFFVFYYFYANKPKMHKTKQAPFAVISKRNADFAFSLLRTYVRRYHGGARGEDYLFPWTIEGKIVRDKAMSYSQAVDGLRELLREEKIPDCDKYGGPSARRGGFIDRAGSVPMNFIQTQGHWSPGSSVTEREYGHQSLEARLKYF